MKHSTSIMLDTALTCPRCDSNQVVKNGKIHNGNQNFKCKSCGRQLGARLADSSLLVVITLDAPSLALHYYEQRWQIETLFGCLKSRGFNLEATHLHHRHRLSKLLALLTIALVWAIHTGLWQQQRSPLPLKVHGRPARSLFRLGLDFLRRMAFNLEAQPDLFRQSLQFLSCT